MKVNRLLVVLFAVMVMQSALATIFDVINLSPNRIQISFVFKNVDNGSTTEVDILNMESKEQRRIDSYDTPSINQEASFFKLDQIHIVDLYGEYNASDPLNWDNPVWTRKINWNWSPSEILERERATHWDIYNLGMLNILGETLTKIMDIVKIRVYSHGKCEIIKDNKMKTFHGKLDESHKEDV